MNVAGGRPAMYAPEIAAAVLDRMSNGETLKSITSDPEMPSFTTVWKWEREIPEFAKLSAQAREEGTHHIADDCIKIADRDDLEPQDKRIRIDTRIRLIGKWNAKRYGDRVSTELSGPDGGPIQTESPDAAKLAQALLAALNKGSE